MSLKSAVRTILTIAIFFAARGGMALSIPTPTTPIAYVQNMQTQPTLACIGCSGNGGGPG